MITVVLASWIGLMIPLPQTGESVIPSGSIPAGIVLQGWSVLTEQQVITEYSTLGHRPLKMIRPLRLSVPGCEILLLGMLRSEGIELKPIRRGVSKSAHWATTDPSASPPLARYEVRVIRIEHVHPEPICKLLRNEAGKREASTGPLDRRSRFVPDLRSGSVIISCASPARLSHYLKLLSAADRPPVAGTHRPVLRHWRTRFGRASELALELDRAWEDRGGVPIHVVPHGPSNTLLIRVPKHIWPAVLTLLEQLDRDSDS